MRRIVLTYIFLSVISILGAGAQNTFNSIDPVTGRDQFGNQVDPNTLPDNLEDSTNTEIQSIPPKLYMWRLSEKLGDRTIIPADTANLNFQNTNLVEGMYGHYNYLATWVRRACPACSSSAGTTSPLSLWSRFPASSSAPTK